MNVRLYLIYITLFINSLSSYVQAQDFVDFQPNLRKNTYVKVKVDELHPTQAVVGMIEVEARIEKLEKMNDEELKIYLKEKVAPIVVGPGGVPYIVDHHHLSRALLDGELKKKMYAQVVENWSDLEPDEFWKRMKERNWVYLMDENGNPISYEDIPKSLENMKNDSFRSLAWGVREEGGFLKTTAPFVEYKWANYFRTLFKKKDIEKDFEKVVAEAMEASSKEAARNLPGFLDCNAHVTKTPMHDN
ncbi:MAG: ParB-like protein [Bacteriovoracaceae bacterium]